MRHLIFPLFVLIVIFSCKEDVVIIPDFKAPASDKVILLEEFTGASCPGCPAGAEAVAEILQRYPENVVVVAVHSDFQAKPVKPGDPDLRTKEADDIQTYLGGWFAKPEAAFNRKQFENQPHIRVAGLPDIWDAFIQKELENFAIADISVDPTYDPGTRTVDFTVTAEALENISGDYRLAVYLTEDDIIADQISVASTIEKYKHKHVLRTALTEIEGSSWFRNLASGLTRERNFSFTFPEEEGWWIPENCHIVAFIADGSSKEVIQAVEVDVVQ